VRSPDLPNTGCQTIPVDTMHCVTATVTNAVGVPQPGVTVRFTVTGSVTISGSVVTDANGEAEFCYTGPALPGADAITAVADSNNDGTFDPLEPSGAATKIWILPTTTPGCEIKITNGGWIIADNGDRASFGGNAKADEDGTVSGQEEYQDHGPVDPFNLHGNVLAIVCDATDENRASIFGEATIDGTGSPKLPHRRDGSGRARKGSGHVSHAREHLRLWRADAGRRQRPHPSAVVRSDARRGSDSPPRLT
jgi:hypothetical protein